jgi:hypothetical protein
MIPRPRARYFHLIGHPTNRHGRFLRASDYRVFLVNLHEGLVHCPVRLISYTILPDRWHLVVGATDPSAFLALAERVMPTRDQKPSDG